MKGMNKERERQSKAYRSQLQFKASIHLSSYAHGKMGRQVFCVFILELPKVSPIIKQSIK